MLSLSEKNPFSFEDFEMKPPLLFSNDEFDYVAVFSCGEHVAMMESQAGRCVKVWPVRRELSADPYSRVKQELQARGFVQQTPVNQDLIGFVEQFMQLAGFTVEHLQRTVQLCQR